MVLLPPSFVPSSRPGVIPQPKERVWPKSTSTSPFAILKLAGDESDDEIETRCGALRDRMAKAEVHDYRLLQACEAMLHKHTRQVLRQSLLYRDPKDLPALPESFHYIRQWLGMLDQVTQTARTPETLCVSMSASKTVLGVLQNVEHPLDAEYGAWIVRYFDDSGHEQQIFAPFQQVDTAERSVLQHNKIWAPFFWLSSRPGFIGCFNPGGYGVVVTLQLCDPTSRDWRNVHNLRLCGFLGHHPFFQGLRISNRIRSGQSRDENGWVPGEDWFVEQNNYHDNDLLEYGLIEHEGRDLPHEDEMLVSVKVNYDMNQINTGDALRVRR